MRKTSLLITLGLALIALAVVAPEAGAYKFWSANVNATGSCASCHAGFRETSPYVSPKGGSWGASLHTVHTDTIMDGLGDCDVCHGGADITAVRMVNLSSSGVAADGVNAISCDGCHGRLQDRVVGAAGEWGAGLRQHHQNAGITDCADCHPDSDPAVFTPVGENIAPAWYATFSLDPANLTGRGENFAGATTGLDNDGDLIYDAADPDFGTANRPPVAVNDAYSTAEDTALTVPAPGVLGNDTDPDANTLTAVLVTTTAHGTLALNANGSFTYTPAANYFGSDTFAYQANDGQAASNTATVTITVTPVNDAPVAANDAYSTAEDTALTVPAPGVLANDSDADGDTLTAAVVAAPANGSLTLNADGSFTYTPAANWNGSDSFTYRASDGQATSNLATVTITVNAVNDAPVADANGPYSGSVGSAVVFDGSGSSDVDGTIASYLWDFGDGSAGSGVSPSHTYLAPGTYTVTLTVTDDGGLTATATTSATIGATNAPPVAVDDAYATAEDTALSVPAPGVLGNDSDADGDPLTAAVVASTTHGSLVLNADGSFTYTPAANYAGPDSFTYRASDGQATSNLATVTITVNAVNDAPLAAANGPYAGTVGEPVTFDGSGSSDVDGTIASYAWDFGDEATGSGVGPTHTYAAPGEYTVTLTVTDDGGLTGTATTTATITARAVLDLDIARFSASKNVRLGKQVTIKLTVVNGGMINSAVRLATVVGVRDGVEVYRETLVVFDPVGKGPSKFVFPTYRPVAAGTIAWVATIDDDDPDIDVATATTTVK